MTYLNGKNLESTLFTSNTVQRFSQEFRSHLRVPIVISLGARYYIDLDCLSSYPTQNALASRFVPYLGMGVGVALAGRMNSTLSIEDITNNVVYTLENKSTTTFHPAPVVYGEVGVNYKISNRISVVAGVRFSALSLMNSKQKINSYIEDGIEKVPGMTTADLETEFVREWDIQEIQNPDKPSKFLAERYPASGIAITCGILFDIGQGGRTPQMNPTNVRLNNAGKIDRRTYRSLEVPAIDPVKIKLASQGAACTNCPEIDIIYRSNNDSVNFPGNRIILTDDGPWGKAEMDSITFPDTLILCEPCPGSGTQCCCRLAMLTVCINFSMTIDTVAINEGVWLNTRGKPGKFGRTEIGLKCPSPNPGDWKQVDLRSVVVHERQHFNDLKIYVDNEIKKVLLSNKEFHMYSCMCSEDNDSICKEKIKKYLPALLAILNKKAQEKVAEIAKLEKKKYGDGLLEKRARAVQAEELNTRGQKN
ncbi:MAG: hypothetical protein IH596_14020 [Bacteroidales bacterium]|nr:hypothetical protein [Bacteroidales bacterium]